MARVVSPSLTTMKMPLLDMGKEAARSLLRQREDRKETVQKNLSLKAELIVRDSAIPVGAK